MKKTKDRTIPYDLRTVHSLLKRWVPTYLLQMYLHVLPSYKQIRIWLPELVYSIISWKSGFVHDYSTSLILRPAQSARSHVVQVQPDVPPWLIGYASLFMTATHWLCEEGAINVLPPYLLIYALVDLLSIWIKTWYPWMLLQRAGLIALVSWCFSWPRWHPQALCHPVMYMYVSTQQPSCCYHYHVGWCLCADSSEQHLTPAGNPERFSVSQGLAVFCLVLGLAFLQQ